MDEIVVNPSRTEPIEKYLQYFDSAKAEPAFGNLTFKRNASADEDFLALFDNNELVSVLQLNVRDHGLWQITYAQTEPKWQGHGCFRFLLDTAVATHQTVLSDEHQTQEAKRAWQSLIEYPGGKLEIAVYDIATGSQWPTYNVPEDEIWNNKTNPVLLITNRAVDMSARERVMERLKASTGIDRTYAGIWYSYYPNYFNP